MEGAQHAAGDHGHPGLVDATGGHALVCGLDHHGDTARLQHLLDRVGDLRGELLLDLQALGIALHHPGELADPHYPPMRQIGHVGSKVRSSIAIGSSS